MSEVKNETSILTKVLDGQSAKENQNRLSEEKKINYQGYFKYQKN